MISLERSGLTPHSSQRPSYISTLGYLPSCLLLIWALFDVDGLIDLLGAWGALGLTWAPLWMKVIYSARHVTLYAPRQGQDAISLLPRLMATVGLTSLYLAIYFKPSLIWGWVRLTDPLTIWLTGSAADQWSFYSALYTAAVLCFGVRSLYRFAGSRYHTLRTLTLMGVQLGLAFLIPALLKKAQLPDFYFSYFWPLKPDYLLPFDYMIDPSSGLISAQLNGMAVGRAMLLWSLLMTFILTPLLTYLYGKRWYCSWVCGCGALAETFGDSWRHLTPKSQGSWRWERYTIHFSLVLIVGVTALLWLNEAQGRALLGSDGSQWFWGGYGLLINMIFSGVIGVGFYPLFGPRVWCRYGCPQAAILGLIQRFWSRFQIRTNQGQCISCGRCSASCEMGIDVRAYAQEGEVIIRASCVGCGVCASVCPRGVLRLESSRPRS